MSHGPRRDRSHTLGLQRQPLPSDIQLLNLVRDRLVHHGTDGTTCRQVALMVVADVYDLG
jgi:hypothetical protein